jgi:hypothetical protein
VVTACGREKENSPVENVAGDTGGDASLADPAFNMTWPLLW